MKNREVEKEIYKKEEKWYKIENTESRDKNHICNDRMPSISSSMSSSIVLAFEVSHSISSDSGVVCMFFKLNMSSDC